MSLVMSAVMAGVGIPLAINAGNNGLHGTGWDDSYALDLTANALYTDMGFHRTTGFNKAGFNEEGFDEIGNHYAGPLYNWQKYGFGIYSWSDGTRYIGSFTKDNPSGFGLLNDISGGTYIGNWNNGAEDGIGVYIAPNGEHRREVWKAGEKISSRPAGKIRSEAASWVFFGEGSSAGWAEGKGDAVTANLSTWVKNGVYRNGHLESGKMIMPDGTAYSGNFSDGVLTDGEIRRPDNTLYNGALSGGVPNGTGRLTNADGTVYEGNFQDGMYQGEGKLILSNGDIFEGPFENGQPHGEGIYKNKSENLVERCEFYEGRRIDQAYIIRIERAKEEERERLAAEHAKKVAEEKARAEREHQRKLEEDKRKAESRKAWGSLAMGGAGALMASSAGMDTGEALLFGASVGRDVYEGTDGKYMREAGDFIINNRKAMAEYENKYGASDLSTASGYSSSLSNLPSTNHTSDYNLPEPVIQPQAAIGQQGSMQANGGKTDRINVQPASQGIGTSDSDTSRMGNQSNTETLPDPPVLKSIPRSSKSGKTVLSNLIDREEKYTPNFSIGEISFSNPQPGIASLTVKLGNGSMGFGEITWNGKYKWQAAEGFEQELPSSTGCVVELSSNHNRIYVMIDQNAMAVKGSGENYGYNLAWSAFDSTLKSVSGSSYNTLSEEECRAVFEDLNYSSYRATAAWLIW
jgi:hypothetical protein